jgi:hypothetical protein
MPLCVLTTLGLLDVLRPCCRVCMCLQRSKQASISCPDGGAIKIRLAEFGEAIDFRDVTSTVASQMCSGSSCYLDITRLGVHGGKVLRVEWECACGAGFKPARAQDDTCTPCEAGSFRTAGMIECLPCNAGWYQPQSGQARSYTTLTCSRMCMILSSTNRVARVHQLFRVLAYPFSALVPFATSYFVSSVQQASEQVSNLDSTIAAGWHCRLRQSASAIYLRGQ